MSSTRASMSKQPGRISSNRAGSMLHSSVGRPTTAFSPTLGYIRPSNTQAWVPSSSSMTRGAALLQARREAAVEEIGRFDQMVVHGDDGHPDLPGLGIGQQRHPASQLGGSHEKMTLSSGFDRRAGTGPRQLQGVP